MRYALDETRLLLDFVIGFVRIYFLAKVHFFFVLGVYPIQSLSFRAVLELRRLVILGCTT
jgi:hypothetical protein